MRPDHIFLLALFASPVIVLTALVVLVAVWGWGVVWILGSAILLFVVLSLVRDFLSERADKS